MHVSILYVFQMFLYNLTRVMFSWVLRLERVDAKQIDDTPNFCKTPVNHFKWRVTFKLYFPPIFFLLGILFEAFFEGRRGKEATEIEFKRELGYFLWQHFIWVRSVNSTCFSWEFAWTVELWIYSIPNVNTLSQKMLIGRAPHRMSSGACLLFWLLWKAIWLLNKTSTPLGSVQWCLYVI